MPANRDKTDQWNADVARSVDMYNLWFLEFAPPTFRNKRVETTAAVRRTLEITGNLAGLEPDTLKHHPEVLPSLRMSTCPPLAVDRLIGLAGVPKNLVDSMETQQRIPPRMSTSATDEALRRLCGVILKMVDPDIFVWLGKEEPPTDEELSRAATIVADRLSGAQADPIVRNEQEKRQLAALQRWLEQRGYQVLPPSGRALPREMPPGTFAFRVNVPCQLAGTAKMVNVPVDAMVMPRSPSAGQMPLLIEAKSAGDFTNVNKRRKEEATKVGQLRATYGKDVQYVLFLCGYFDSGYLGYEAAEGIDWVWEHRMDDFALLGL